MSGVRPYETPPPAWAFLPGLQVHVSRMLPYEPSPGEDARRIVRHGLADVLDWLGEKVGPKPGALTQALVIGSSVSVSPDLYRKILDSPEVLREHL